MRERLNDLGDLCQTPETQFQMRLLSSVNGSALRDIARIEYDEVPPHGDFGELTSRLNKLGQAVATCANFTVESTAVLLEWNPFIVSGDWHHPFVVTNLQKAAG